MIKSHWYRQTDIMNINKLILKFIQKKKTQNTQDNIKGEEQNLTGLQDLF